MNPGEYSEENLKKELAASKNNKDAILLPNRSDLFKVPKVSERLPSPSCQKR